MSHNEYQLVAAWPNQEQSASQIAHAAIETMRSFSEASSVPFEWYLSGSAEPLDMNQMAVEALVESAVWQHAVTREANPAKGYSLAFVGWRSGMPHDVWEMAVDLTIFAGKTDSVARSLWPNSVSLKFGEGFTDDEVISIGRKALPALLQEWPVAWAALESPRLRMEAIGSIGQPASNAGLITWVSDRLASVPLHVPHSRVEPLADGTLITVRSAPRNLQANVLGDVNNFLTKAGSLPRIPASY